MKMAKKIFKIIIICIAIGIGIFILNYLRINISYGIHKNEYKDSFLVYGNTNNYVPQGLTYSSTNNVVLQTSYNSQHKVSMLYVIDFKNGKLIKSLKLKDPEGNINNHHVGGVTTDNDKVWITNDYEVEEYSLDEILNTKEEYIQSLTVKKLPIRGDFCTYNDGMLWIGDFYLKPFYDVPDGNPLLLGYSLDDGSYSNPEVAISLPKMVQGLIINDKGEFAFTRSFTYLIKSSFSIYENVLEKDTKDTIDINQNKVPYYKFNKSNLVDEIKLPPMAEEGFFLDGYYYILFESSTDSYSMALPKMKYTIQYKIK